MIRLYCENNTLKFVADAVGISPQAVHVILRRRGFDTKRKCKPKAPKFSAKRGTSKERFWLKVNITDADSCWLWKNKTSFNCGYGTHSFKGKNYYSHHLTWFFTYGRFSNQWILHRCGNGGCCNPNHLYEGTPKDNAQDRIRHGTVARGEKAGRAKLTEQQAVEIKFLTMESDVNYSAIGRQYGVGSNAIIAIAKGKTWKHIQTS